MAMEFWGVEVEAGKPLKVVAEEGIIVHLSQAALGEVKKDKKESVLVNVHFEGKNIVLGTLSTENCPQIAYDLVFEKDFELSHNWKNGSVFFCGYRAEIEDDEGSDGMFESDSEEEEEPVVAAAANGKAEAKAEKPKAVIEKAKADKSAAAKKGKDVKPVIVGKDDEDTSDEDSDDLSDGSDDEEMADGVTEDSSDEDDDDSSDEDDEDTPKNAKQSKKRPAESASKTPPAQEKKAKLVTPQKSGGDGKKGGNAHTATPHPSKQAGKAKAEKSKSPKSAGQIACKSCTKTFNSDGALQSHTKAKHTEAK